MRLVPKEFSWAIYSVLYFGFFFIDPILSHAGARVWLFTAIGTAAFLFLYFRMFWVSRRQALLHVAGMVLLGIAYARYNGGATTFFIFAAASAPFILEDDTQGIVALLAIEGSVFLTWWAFHLNGWFLLFAAGLSFVIGISNVHFAQRNRTQAKLLHAQEEIQHLAQVAERERIARDLHDVLGHTLSVITLKSELAGKLIERDPQRAGKEISEVEQISRQALGEVRDAIRGYRAQGLAAELARAKSTLETAGLTVQCDTATTVQIPALQESVLALAVREAVTNVVRHAHASSCHVRLDQQNGSFRLEIRDDGQGCSNLEGNGLRGMRERVEMLGGALERKTEPGTTLTITLPIESMPKSEGRRN